MGAARYLIDNITLMFCFLLHTYLEKFLPYNTYVDTSTATTNDTPTTHNTNIKYKYKHVAILVVKIKVDGIF